MIPQWDELFAAWGAADFEAMHRELDRVWAGCYRALIPGGILAVNIGDAVRSVGGEFRLWPNHARTVVAAEGLGFRSLPYILWKKPTNKPNAFLGSGFLPPNAYVTLDCEFILLFREGVTPQATGQIAGSVGQSVHSGGTGSLVLPDLGGNSRPTAVSGGRNVPGPSRRRSPAD